MATINSRQVVDTIIAGNGIYPGDEDMPVLKIVEYNNAFDGAVCYGLIYKGDPMNHYQESPYIRNPKTIWEHESIRKPERRQIPDIDTLTEWMDSGVAEALDGCEVEPDGHCPHGKPSWLIRMGLI